MSSIGRAAAVADLRWLRLSGYPAWWVWLLVHLMMLIQFGNKVLVMVQWAWSYWTHGRSARLITRYCYNRSQVCLLEEEPLRPPIAGPPPVGALRPCAHPLPGDEDGAPGVDEEGEAQRSATIPGR